MQRFWFCAYLIENDSDWSRKRSEREKIKNCEVDSVFFSLCSGWKQFWMSCIIIISLVISYQKIINVRLDALENKTLTIESCFLKVV